MEVVLCNFKKGKTLPQTEAIEMLKRGCDNLVPTDVMQDHCILLHFWKLACHSKNFIWLKFIEICSIYLIVYFWCVI